MPLIVDPALQAAVIRQFNLRGELAPFNLTENVIPTFDIGRITGFDPTVVTTTAGTQGVRIGTPGSQGVVTRPGSHPAAGIVNSGAVVNPAAGTVLADTGALGAGSRLFHWVINSNAAAVTDFAVEWRDAANLVTVAIWTFFVGGNTESVKMFDQFMLTLAANERVRIVNTAVVVGTVNATIGQVSVTRSGAT